jgi:O-antigen/teichoic acid export membrane protein
MKTHASLRKQLIKSFLGIGAMKLFALPIGLLTSIILARMLGPSAFGQYAFVMGLLPLLALPIAGGIPQLLTREIAGYVHESQWAYYRGIVRSAHYWIIGFSILTLVLYAFLNPILGILPSSGKWELLNVGILLLPLLGLNAARNGVIKGLGFPAYAEMPTQLIQPFIVLIAYSFLALSGLLTSKSALWFQFFCGALTFLFATALFLKVKPKEAIHYQPIYESKKWACALLPFTLIALLSTFNIQIGIVLLGLMGTDEGVAALRVGERGAQFVVISLGLVNMIISPYIVKSSREGNMLQLQQLSRQSARGAFAIALIISSILILYGKQLIELAFGVEYALIAYVPLVILVSGQLLNVFFGSVGQLLSMSGYERDTLLGQGMALLVNIIACIALIPLYGPIGAAIGSVLGITTWNILLASLVYKRLGIRPTAF